MTEFIQKNAREGWRKAVGGRISLPDYPEKAIEEALVNALIHRDYLQLGAEIHIDMYDNRLEITNPGGMLEGKPIQERDPRQVPSKTRNPIIADMFDRMNYMERRGSGFKKILDEYESQDKYDEKLRPVFYSDFGDFKLTLWNLNYSAQEIHQVNHQDIHQDNHQLPTDVSEENILRYCGEPKSMLQLAEHFNYKDRSYFRRKYIVPLIREKKLFMTQPEKPNSREQKYY